MLFLCLGGINTLFSVDMYFVAYQLICSTVEILNPGILDIYGIHSSNMYH